MSKLFVPAEILREDKSLHAEVSMNEAEWSWEERAKIYDAEVKHGNLLVQVKIRVTENLWLMETDPTITAFSCIVKEAMDDSFKKYKILKDTTF